MNKQRAVTSGQTAVIVIVAVIIAAGAVFGAMSILSPPQTQTVVQTTVQTQTQVRTQVQTETVVRTETPTTVIPPRVFTNHTIRVGSNSGEIEQDPQFNAGFMLPVQTWESLTRITMENGKPKTHALLATDWTESDGGKLWTFKLRPNVKFHDGTAFKADAVKFSFERAMLLPVRNAPDVVRPFESIKVVDDLTVQIRTKFPLNIPHHLAGVWSTWINSPAMVDDALKAGVIEKSDDPKVLHENLRKYLVSTGGLGPNGQSYGTGPYYIQPGSYDPVKGAVLVRNNNYWGGWEPGQVDKIILDVISDPSLIARLMLEGEIDFISEGVPIQFYTEFVGNPKFNIFISGNLGLDFIEYNTKNPPLDNRLVRRALSYAIPYDSLKKLAYFGYAKAPGVDLNGFASNDLPFSHSGLPSFTFNMTKARQLLVEAGYPDGKLPGVTLLWVTSIRYPEFPSIIEGIRPYWRELGVNIDSRVMQPGAFFGIGFRGLQEPTAVQHIAAKEWSVNSYSRYHQLSSIYGQSAFNWAYWNNAEFRKLIADAWAIELVNENEARDLYSKAERILFEEAPGVGVLQALRIIAFQKNIVGYEPNPAQKLAIRVYELRVTGT
jgi:peptide/nickel transport system substrate-binding protein